MDLFTHAAVGVALSRAGLRKATPGATLLLIVAAIIPDIDMVSLTRGQLAYLEFHCGYTHSLAAIPILAFICACITAVFKKIHWLEACLIGCVGVTSHLLLDWTGSYGIRALLPFSSRWFYLDLNGSYDAVLWSALGLMLVWPRFENLVSGEIGAVGKNTGRGSAIAALSFLVLFESGRWAMHSRAVAQVSSRLYDGEIPLSVAALPDPINPLAWTGVVETQATYRTVTTALVSLDNAADSRVFLKPDTSASYQAAMKTEPFRYMAYFSRFPVWSIGPVPLNSGYGELLDLTDLRFEGKLHAGALTDSTGRVVASKFVVSAGEVQLLLEHR